MEKVKTRKFAWMVLVMAMALVAGPTVTTSGPVFGWPNANECPPFC